VRFFRCAPLSLLAQSMVLATEPTSACKSNTLSVSHALAHLVLALFLASATRLHISNTNSGAYRLQSRKRQTFSRAPSEDTAVLPCGPRTPVWARHCQYMLTTDSIQHTATDDNATCRPCRRIQSQNGARRWVQASLLVKKIVRACMYTTLQAHGVSWPRARSAPGGSHGKPC
jgi:hypothetical protein